MWQLVGIGSNIAPAENIGLALQHLLRRHRTLIVSSAQWTRPRGMQSDLDFINMAMLLPRTSDEQDLKRQFNALETALGRDRTDPMSKVANRPLDLDILAAMDLQAPLPQLDEPPYIMVTIRELLDFVRQSPQPRRAPAAPAVFAVAGTTVGERPLVLHWSDNPGSIRASTDVSVFGEPP
ncbi:MAG TPA: 2-amino-4-hydroxy-6-hydroxymethyldihydropteridine diphosphokinase [Salinisphaeraceae bacterium]|nr:2-amino-4-hydroxy-6-hydroxymethyldihydropteridine diphosphokinase [Salinisphaeraceae bacterium]